MCILATYSIIHLIKGSFISQWLFFVSEMHKLASRTLLCVFFSSSYCN